MNGVMSKRSNVALKFQANDLREIETVADLFRTPAAGSNSATTRFGRNSHVYRDTRRFHDGTESERSAGCLELQVHGTTWRVVRTGVDVSPSLAKLQNAVLEPASQGRISTGRERRPQEMVLHEYQPHPGQPECIGAERD